MINRLWGNYFRVVIVLVSFMCLVSVCSNYIIINFTFICMKDDFSETKIWNGTIKSAYDYTPIEKKHILWAVAFGTIVGIFPMNMLYVRCGARLAFFSAGVLSAITTGLTPWAASQSIWALVAFRFLQGVAYSADFAAIGIVISKWAPLDETAVFISTLTSFTSISSIITNGVSGVICESHLGWKWSFYFHAAACLAVFIIWALVYKDDPTLHKSVSAKELGKIQRNKSESHIKDDMEIPYVKIFTSPVVLTVWLCAFTELSTLILIATYAPIYFRSVLGFDIKIIGFYLGLMLAIHLPFRFVCAFLSDKTKCISEISKIHIFNTLAVGCVGISFIVFRQVSQTQPSSKSEMFSSQIPAEHNISAVVCLAVLECFTSFNCGGFYKCGTLHARQFSSIVISAIQFTKCISLFSGPALVAFFVTDETNQIQWSYVFFVLAGFTFLANILSFIFFTDQPAKWTEDGGVVKYSKEKEIVKI
ncbi:Protein CBG19966 [Caenorhabditis briggsae]|uniref:Protein CBG19966 n=1 Tax=Caenorhabditis briggsae TaxID=6238 RepID=A8XWU2_CAEBR|nr:Protein CBG19966 [Caenorhabditis briggsae]CAP37111.2 Protein CBG19966 [Caenorhabditis briggsae]